MAEPASGGGPQTLRLMNYAAVLAAVREAGSARVTELVRATGLSRPTVSSAVSTLLADGWVEEIDAPETELLRVGRPARVLRFRADARHVLGIDIGPHRVSCVVADLNGTMQARARRDVAGASSHAELLSHVEAAMGSALAEAGVPRTSLAAVGVGTPGIVDERRGSVVQAPSVPGWNSLELGNLLQRRLTCPVHVENDVNLAVIAERWHGAGNHVDNVLLVHWGVRVGAALLLDGRLFRGAHGAAGEIGFVDVAEEPQGVQEEGLGPLEATVGIDGILRRARHLGDHEGSDAMAVLTAAAGGDERSLQVLDEACAAFARGLAPFLAAIDPELVIVGGSITLAGDAILAGLRRHLTQRSLVVPRLELSTLGDDAVVLGAMRLALADAERRLLSQVPRTAGDRP